MELFVFLGLHIGVCVWIGTKLHKKKSGTGIAAFPVALLVPVVGALMLLVEWWIEKRGKSSSRDIKLEKLEIRDAKFKRIEVERNENVAIVVPLEEAIAVNDAKTRRKLLLDILHRNPEEHIALLQRARLSDDTELTHYATTTMMEIQGGFERKIRTLEKEVEVAETSGEHAEIVRALRKLRKELEHYIESGLITEHILNIYRNKLDDVLQRLLKEDPKNKGYYLGWIENRINLGRVEELEKHLNQALQKWEEDEEIYRLFIRYYATAHQGEKIQGLLKEIEEKKIYLSREGKRWYAFWKNEESK